LLSAETAAHLVEKEVILGLTQCLLESSSELMFMSRIASNEVLHIHPPAQPCAFEEKGLSLELDVVSIDAEVGGRRHDGLTEDIVVRREKRKGSLSHPECPSVCRDD